VKSELANSLPRKNVPPIPGSVTRLVEIREGGKIYWEGKPIDAAGSARPTTEDAKP
jgi:hypothetical protein